MLETGLEFLQGSSVTTLVIIAPLGICYMSTMTLFGPNLLVLRLLFRSKPRSCQPKALMQITFYINYCTAGEDVQ